MNVTEDLSRAPLRFTGLHSHLDTDHIIEALSKLQKRPIDLLQAENNTLAAHQTIYNNLGTALTSLDTLLGNQQMTGGFFENIATISDPSQMTVAAGSLSSPSSYAIQVTNLATVQRNYSSPFSDPNTTGLMGSGTLEINAPDGNTYNLNIDNTTTLNTFYSSIDDLNIGLSAQVIQAESQYYLVVSGQNTGSSNSFTFTDSGTETGLSSSNSKVQAATDATIVLDNTITISRPTNTINDVIAGVTLNLLAKSSNSAQLNIDMNTTSLQNSIQQVITDVNTVINQINTATSFSGNPDRQKLVGDSVLNGLLRNLQTVIGTTLTQTSSGPISLAALGVTTQRDNTLALNSTTLNNFIENEFSATQTFFLGDSSSGSLGFLAQLQNFVEQYSYYSTGILQQVAQSIQDSIGRNQSHLNIMETESISYAEQLRQKFNAMESLLGKISTRGQNIENFTHNMPKWFK